MKGNPMKKALLIANTAVFIAVAATAAYGLVTLGHEMIKAVIEGTFDND